MIGSRIGVYEVVAPLGSGGMGEVYRARDTRLGREVALKVLPTALGSDPESLARFEREARSLAALSHPNIATLYGVEDSAGVTALVMELVEGETLEERLGAAAGRAGGPLALPEVLAIARQIAGALDAAHQRGIVHRDLKPANVKISPSGDVKVLDFGLAKFSAAATSDSLPASVPSQVPTVLSSGTRVGVILGTAPYMSPEQARGLPVDRQADIWAFGCVLYEMLAGRRAFEGETVTDVLAGILEREPDWTALPRSVPTPIERLLRRCLAKAGRQRLRDIGDAWLEIEDCIDTREPVAVSNGGMPAGDLDFQRLTDDVGWQDSPAISPDGKMIAFVAVVEGKRQICVRFLAGGALLQLTRDPVDHLFPRWAPDSTTLIYYTPGPTRAEEGTIFEVGALGGWPRPVTTAMTGADVSRDGQRLALVRAAGDRVVLATAARDGSRVEQVAELPGAIYSSLRWSPDGRWIAFQRADYSAGFDIALEVIAISGGERRQLVRDSALNGFSWTPDGSGLIYSSSRGSTLLYPPCCNLRTMALDGSGDRALTFGDDAYIHPDAHASGRILASRIRLLSDIWKFPVAGSPADNTRSAIRITRQTGQVQTPSVSPDETRVVYLSDNGGHANLWVADTTGFNSRQITFETEPAVSLGVPKWSPHGDLIAFVVNRAGQAGLWVIRPDGTGLRHVVRGWAPCWSNDGRWLYYWRLGEERRRIEKICIEGGEPVLVREEPGGIAVPALSPDGATLYVIRPANTELVGQWWWGAMTEICRASPESGPAEVLIRLSGDRTTGAPGPLIAHVAVSPDGRRLATSLIDGATTNLWALPASGGDVERLTDFGDRPTLITRSVSWSPDGRHIYAAVAEPRTNIVLVNGLLARPQPGNGSGNGHSQL